MELRLNINMASLFSQRYLANTTQSLAKTMERLSSGLRINRSADDAAGLAIGNKLATQVHGNAQAIENAQYAMNYAQVADGGLSTIADHIQRIRELVIQAANDTLVQSDREKIQLEINQRLTEIDRTALVTKFNDIPPLQIPPPRLAELTRPKSGPADISFIVDTSGTMGPFILNVQTNLNQFLNDLGAANIDFRISVTSMADNLNGGNPGQPFYDAVDNTNTILDSTNNTADITNAVNALVSSGALVDPFNSMLEVANVGGAADTPGQDGIARPNPAVDLLVGQDAVTRRPGVRYFQIIVTDTVPEETTGTIGGAAASAAREAAVAAALAADGVTVFGVLDPVNNAVYDDIIGATGGQAFDLNSPTFAQDLQAIVQAISNAVSQPGEMIIDEGAIQIQIGANEGQLIGFDRPHITYDALGLLKIDVAAPNANFDDMISQTDKALEKVASLRTHYGAGINRLEQTISSLSIAQENMNAAQSRMMDADFAVETANLAKNQILQQAGNAVLSQANILPQSALLLLG